MSDTYFIANILKRAKTEHQPYPKTFEYLKEAGVQTCEVSLAPYRAIYNGAFGQWEEPAPEGLTFFVISEIFDKKGAVKALERHQQKETTYVEFLSDMAAAGVTCYSVDMAHRQVTYYGRDSRNYYREEVPTL